MGAPEKQRGPRFDARIFRLIPNDEFEEWSSRFQSAKAVREIISQVLTDEIEADILRVEAQETLDSPNALAVVAASIGYRRGLRQALKLLTNQDTQ